MTWQTRNILQPTFLRITGFLALQICFLSLALACIHTPLPIQLTSTSPEVRGAFSVALVAWQFIAALLVNDLLLQVLGEEWSTYLLTHPFQPGCDEVSTLTANIFFHIRHVVTRRTSLAYKAASVGLALLTILRTMGPASITIAVAPRRFSNTIRLAKYARTTFDPTDRRDPVMASIQRAEVIARVEQEMRSEVGWKVAGTALIGRQEKEVVDPNVTTTYPSDVASFGFRCEWHTPQVQQESGGLVFIGNGTQWRVWNAESANDIIVGIYTLYDASRSFDGRSAYLFVGCDGSNRAGSCLVNLGSTPSTSVPAPSQPRIAIPMPLNFTISLLVCDPKHSVITTRVIAAGNNIATLPSADDGLATQNNLPKKTVELIFAASLLSALSPLSASPGRPSPMSTLAARVFVDTHGKDIRTWASRFDFAVDVLDMDTIQKNMDAAMISASKAFLIKPAAQGSGQFSGFETVTAPAIIDKPVILLVGSRPFVYATIGLLAAFVFSGILIFLGRRNQYRLPLNLAVILKVITHGSVLIPHPDDPEKSSEDKPLPVIIGDFHPLPADDTTDNLAQPPVSDVHWYWPRKYIAARVVMFIVLQLTYYAIAIVYHVCPFNLPNVSPVALQDSFDELKGGLIVAFTAWQTFSIALLNDVLFTIFSLEWAVQAEKKFALEPGVTDRVSTLASGLFDRVRYAFDGSQKASGMFRYALAASVVLMLISATGPGCFTLSTTTPVDYFTPIHTGNPMASKYLLPHIGPTTKEEAALLDHIAAITQLEQLEGFTWGYDMPSGWFLPWPFAGNGEAFYGQEMEYPGVASRFKFNCRWEIPVPSEIEMQSDIEKPLTSGIVPVKFTNTARNAFGHSGILLAGCENPNAPQSDGCILDLSGLPTRTESNEFWNGTVALLACDPSERNFDSPPNLSYKSEGCGRITLADNHLHFKSVDVQIPSNSYDDPFRGNIFASSLLYALRPPLFAGRNIARGAVGIGPLAGQLFFNDFTTTFDSNTALHVASVPLFEIESKMNKYLSSATKAFMSGYDPALDQPSSRSLLNLTGPVDAKMVRTVAQITIVGNKTMIISSVVLLAIALRLLECGLRSVFWKQSRLRILEPFGIASVVRMQRWLELMKEGSSSP